MTDAWKTIQGKLNPTYQRPRSRSSQDSNFKHFFLHTHTHFALPSPFMSFVSIIVQLSPLPVGHFPWPFRLTLSLHRPLASPTSVPSLLGFFCVCWFFVFFKSSNPHPTPFRFWIRQNIQHPCFVSGILGFLSGYFLQFAFFITTGVQIRCNQRKVANIVQLAPYSIAGDYKAVRRNYDYGCILATLVSVSIMNYILLDVIV